MASLVIDVDADEIVNDDKVRRSTPVADEEEDSEQLLRAARPPAKKKSRVIVESDGEEDASDDDVASRSALNSSNTVEVESDVSSPREDDAFAHELELKQEARVRAGTAGNWMAAFALGNKERVAAAAVAIASVKKHHSSSHNSHSHIHSTSRLANSMADDGWHSISDLKEKRLAKQLTYPKPLKHKFQDRSDGEDDSEDDGHHVRTHDEVGQLLRDCEQIAEKLRRSIKSWSSGPTSIGSLSTSTDTVDSDEDDVAHVSIAAISASTAESDRRVVTQRDIPKLCETLELKPYQVVGVNWLLLLCENAVSGVLADEMGLGKTVQTVAFLLLLDDLAKKQQRGVCSGPHVVVVPASVLSNWQREFAWIAPTLRVVVYHGAKDGRLDLQDTLHASDFDVLLTTYSYFERDSCQDDRNFLRSFEFGYMILDEGHSIKNPKTSRFRRISQMRARTRLVLSGTPIQNSLNELLALLSFLMPRMFDHGSDELLLFFDGSEQKKCAKVRKILAPFILRREKRYVLSQLVPKTVHVEMLQPGPSQRKAYTDILDSVIKQKENRAAFKIESKELKQKLKGKYSNQVRGLLGLDDETPKRAHKDSSQSDIHIFTQLRKAANHPALLRHHYVDKDVLTMLTQCLHRAGAFGKQCSLAMVQKELESSSDFELHDLCVQYSANEELRKLRLPVETLLASVKFDYLRRLLPTLHADGHRVLIFSQWTKLLDLLEVLMDHMQYRFLRLDGSTNVAERQDLIDTYNKDTGIFVFLLSTRAGGLGINLTAADTVILHDLDFNPTSDEQACDRCHRIGQTKPVTIYKLVSENSVDHDIFKLGESKTQLNHAVLGKLNAHYKSDRGPGRPVKDGEANNGVTVEMMLASVISKYKQQQQQE